MRRKTLLTIILLLCSFMVPAQRAIGTWRSHAAYHNATQCVAVGDKIYVVSDGSLYSFTPDDEWVECYNKTNLLSDQGIRHIAVDEQSGTLVIIYNNANIDLMRHDGEVTNITDYTNKAILDPMINDIRIVKGNAYLATNFGLTVLNIERGEFANTYALGKVTHSCIELGGYIYAATAEGIYCGSLEDNLLDTKNWKQMSVTAYAKIEILGNELLALKNKESVYRINPTNGEATLLRKGPIHYMQNIEGRLYVGNKTNVYVYNTLTDVQSLVFDKPVNCVTVSADTYWSATGTEGLNGYTLDKTDNKMVHTVGPIIPNSPVRNHCQYLHFVDNERLLIAGGCLNYFGETFFDGTLMMYEDGTWTSFQEEGIAEQTGVYYKNMTSIVQDPKDENHHYASSFGQGLYEFRDMKLVAHYNHKNSLLESVSSKPDKLTSIRVSRLQYDKQGNLWLTNADGAERVESPLKIIRPDGSMMNLYYKELEKLPTVTEVLFDRHDRVWVVSMRYDVRLFCINLNGTLENTADDRVKTFNEKFIDQDGQAVEVYYINDIAEDINGDIWVLTDGGPYVLYNTERVFDDNYHFTKIKVPRNDGTNYADYLLDGVYTTCMVVDAANRKWIGTLSNGLYLIAEDGLETIHHFTVDNSPLPSNTIESVALHPVTGELYIGTDKGLVSYVSDAQQAEERYEEEKVYAYPNPVYPDYEGLITIVGLKANSNVKIVNTAGRLVAEGTSLGGSFTWDGKTTQGNRVATGVYYVLGADEEGNEGIVTKVLFVK